MGQETKEYITKISVYEVYVLKGTVVYIFYFVMTLGGPAGNSQTINQLGFLQWKFEIQVKTFWCPCKSHASFRLAQYDFCDFLLLLSLATLLSKQAMAGLVSHI